MVYKLKSSQTCKPDDEAMQVADNSNDTIARRKFLKKLGKYSALTSVTTVTLMTAGKASALSPPPPPPDEEEDLIKDSW